MYSSCYTSQILALRFPRYNVQCPDDTYDLHYFMVNFDVEAPNNDDCLDFLRKLPEHITLGRCSLIRAHICIPLAS